MAAGDDGACRRALSSSAWPAAAVVGPDDATVALGALMPRAPAQFWLRHRDGPDRLASLSYLAGDPDRMSVAYGVTVPPPGAAERVALVYALARLLDAWQGGAGPLGRARGPVGEERPVVRAAGAGGICARLRRRHYRGTRGGRDEPRLAGRPPQTGKTRRCHRAGRPAKRPIAMYWDSPSCAW